MIEHIESDGVPLAYIIKGKYLPENTFFVTPDNFKQQVGYVVYSKGSEIPRHFHNKLERHLTGTSEVLLVKKGVCEVTLFTEKHEPVAVRELYEGDIIILINGGHGFRIMKDTVLLEIKQGPYIGPEEKERF